MLVEVELNSVKVFRLKFLTDNFTVFTVWSQMIVFIDGREYKKAQHIFTGIITYI